MRSGSRRVRKSCPLTAPKPSAKGRKSGGPPQFKNMCGHKTFAGRGEQLLVALQKHGNPVAQQKQSNLHYFSPSGKNFADKRPPFRGPEVVRTQANQIETEGVASILGSVSGLQNGGRFVGKILVTGRKTARVSIVSAMRQKFSMLLVFHGFAAPQALVLHTLRTFMATHVLELGRPSVAGPVFVRVFGLQTGAQKNHFFRSFEGAKRLENL